MRRPRIKRTTESFRSPEGDVYLRRPSANRDVRIERPDDEDQRLLAALDGGHPLEEPHPEVGAGPARDHPLGEVRGGCGAESVDDTISQMQELDVIEDAADDDLIEPAERARFDRQLRYFSDIGGDEHLPSECQRRLREAK